jgi:hypothetical protein
MAKKKAVATPKPTRGARLRRKKKKKFAGALTLAMLSSVLMVDGPPAFAASEGVVVCALQGAPAACAPDAPMSQSNQGTFTLEPPRPAPALLPR